MKRIIKLLCILVCICFCNINVYAAPETYDRTPENNYLVTGKDIVVDENNNVNDILSTPAVDASLKVYDFANLYSDTVEKKIYSLISNYIDTYNMDLAVVTINENVKSSTEAYAQDFYDYNDFGIGNNYSGVIFLIDMDNREFYMSTSGEAIKMYNDRRIANLLDSVRSYFVDGDYGDGTIKYIENLEYYAAKGYPSSGERAPRVTGIAKIKSLHWPSIFVISLVGTAFVMYILISNSKLARQANSSRHYLTKADVSKKDEIFMGKSVHHTVRVDTSSGGGSTISRGSSGRSHGGGGRKF